MFQTFTHTATVFSSLLVLALSTPALAGKIDLNTTPDNPIQWQVSEITGGTVVSASPVDIGNTPFGNVPGFTIPFTDCDGFWYADIVFTIPAGARKPTLHITAIGVDDRAVVELNGKIVTSAGADDSGGGFMQLTDPGKNKPYTFKYVSGPVTVNVSKGLIIGANSLRIIVNNTMQSIHGSITPVNGNDPSDVGLAANVTYK